MEHKNLRLILFTIIYIFLYCVDNGGNINRMGYADEGKG